MYNFSFFLGRTFLHILHKNIAVVIITNVLCYCSLWLLFVNLLVYFRLFYLSLACGNTWK